MKRLIIVESPSKAKTIQKYLGNGYQVLASSGHISDLPKRTLGIKIDKDFEPVYEVNKDKKDIIKKLNSAIKKCDEVYLATDPDREGEAISWHLKRILKIDDNKKRIVFNEISKKAVNDAIQKPRDIDMDLVDAQQARRVLDRLVGYKVSPIVSKKIKKGSSAGRVQSPALKMIVEREREIRAFVPEEYWNIFAFLKKQNDDQTFKSTFVDFDGKKFKVTSEKIANRAVLDLDKSKFVVDKVKKSVTKSKPNAPFTTSTMQQDASSKLNMSSPDTMRVAQQLYEGVEVKGEGLTALVTYIRTDSVRISEDMQKVAIDYIINHYGKEYAPKKPNFYKTKKSAQDAHEAIRPINIEVTPESLKDKIDKKQYKLYKLIYDRFLASQMTNATYDSLNVHINAFKPLNEKPFGFVVKGKTVKFKGYTAVYEKVEINKNDDDDDDKKKTLPNIEEGDILNFVDTKMEQKFTRPPARFTDASLVKALEENGIGRPSTYATIISTLSKRAYTEKEAKAIKPTELGEAIADYLQDHFSDIVNLGFTANMESELDSVEEGKLEWQEVLRKFYPNLKKKLDDAVADDKTYKIPDEESDVICEKCGANMVIKTGRYGKFLACPNFPECKNIKPLIVKLATCPDCGGDIYARKSKKGKTFYACSNYPKCHFMSWDLPAPIYCPDCKNVMKLITKKDSIEYKCSNKECGKTIVKEKPAEKEESNE